MLKDVGMVVPKYVEACIHAAKQGMRACNNNNMHNPLPASFISWGYACYYPHPLLCCMDACFLGTTIPTSFNIY